MHETFSIPYININTGHWKHIKRLIFVNSKLFQDNIYFPTVFNFISNGGQYLLFCCNQWARSSSSSLETINALHKMGALWEKGKVQEASEARAEELVRTGPMLMLLSQKMLESTVFPAWNKGFREEKTAFFQGGGGGIGPHSHTHFYCTAPKKFGPKFS